MNSRLHRSTPQRACPIRAVTFDVGGTLIETHPSVGHIYASVAARHGWPNLPEEVLNRQFIAGWNARGDFRYTLAEWRELVRATFQGLVWEPLRRPFFCELYDRFSDPQSWHLFEDVRPTLETLAGRGVKLAVISNWDRRLPLLLRRLKLERYFEAVVVSCFVREPKPSPVIFASAARRLRLPPEAILHVGDNPRMDEQGARRAGFETRLLNRKAPSGKRGEISTLKALCEQLAG